MTLRRMAVIFDMDGVLVDTYRAHFQSWNVVAGEEGTEMFEEQFAATFGRTSREIIAILWPELGDDAAAIQRFDDRKEEAFRRIIATDFPAMPGVERLLAGLAAAGIPTAIGSSGPPANVALVVERLGAKHSFGAVVTADDVLAASRTPRCFCSPPSVSGCRRRRCVVVEDAPAGPRSRQGRRNALRGDGQHGADKGRALGGRPGGRFARRTQPRRLSRPGGSGRVNRTGEAGEPGGAVSRGRSGSRRASRELVENLLLQRLQQRWKWRTVQDVALAAVRRRVGKRLVSSLDFFGAVAIHARLRRRAAGRTESPASFDRVSVALGAVSHRRPSYGSCGFASRPGRRAPFHSGPRTTGCGDRRFPGGARPGSGVDAQREPARCRHCPNLSLGSRLSAARPRRDRSHRGSPTSTRPGRVAPRSPAMSRRGGNPRCWNRGRKQPACRRRPPGTPRRPVEAAATAVDRV